MERLAVHPFEKMPKRSVTGYLVIIAPLTLQYYDCLAASTAYRGRISTLRNALIVQCQVRCSGGQDFRYQLPLPDQKALGVMVISGVWKQAERMAYPVG